MNEEQIIYQNTLNNSIGEEKICDYNKKNKSGKLKVALATVLVAFTVTTSAGCSFPVYNNTQDDIDLETSIDNESIGYEEEYEKKLEDNYYGYNQLYLANHMKSVGIFRLEEQGYTNFSHKFPKRYYHYSAEDFSKFAAEEAYIYYSMYLLMDKACFELFLQGQGYDNLEDYLIKNGYKNTAEWTDAALKQAGRELYEQNQGLGGR